MLRVVTAFQNKITTLFIPDRQFVNFPKLRAVTTCNIFSYDAFVHVLEKFKLKYESRFKDITEYKDLFNLNENNPFMCQCHL